MQTQPSKAGLKNNLVGGYPTVWLQNPRMAVWNWEEMKNTFQQFFHA